MTPATADAATTQRRRLRRCDRATELAQSRDNRGLSRAVDALRPLVEPGSPDEDEGEGDDDEHAATAGGRLARRRQHPRRDCTLGGHVQTTVTRVLNTPYPYAPRDLFRQLLWADAIALAGAAAVAARGGPALVVDVGARADAAEPDPAAPRVAVGGAARGEVGSASCI